MKEHPIFVPSHIIWYRHTHNYPTLYGISTPAVMLHNVMSSMLDLLVIALSYTPRSLQCDNLCWVHAFYHAIVYVSTCRHHKKKNGFRRLTL